MFKKLPLLALFIATSLAALPSQAVATDARQAIRLCEANPNCTFDVKDNGDVELFVGDDWISCPQEGDCHCACTHPTRQVLTSKTPLRALPRNGAGLSQ